MAEPQAQGGQVQMRETLENAQARQQGGRNLDRPRSVEGFRRMDAGRREVYTVTNDMAQQ